MIVDLSQIYVIIIRVDGSERKGQSSSELDWGGTLVADNSITVLATRWSSHDMSRSVSMGHWLRLIAAISIFNV